MSYPGDVFTNIFLYWLPTFFMIGGSLVYFYLFLIILPLFIQIFLNLTISMIKAQFRINIRPIIDLLVLPGSLLRVTVVWFVLRYYGFKFKLAFTLPDAGESATSINRSYRGLTNIALQSNESQKEISPLKISFMVSLASYALMPLVILLLVMGEYITTGMMFLMPYDAIGPVYTYLVLSIALGGLPVPEETMTVILTAMYMYPQLILATMLNLFALLIYVPHIGTFPALVLFLLQLVIHILMIKNNKAETVEFESTAELEAISTY